MKYVHVILVAGASVVLHSCSGTSDETKKQNEAAQLYAEHMRLDGLIGEKAKSIFKPLDAVAVNPENEVTEAKVKLGKVLYFDKRLSKEGNISCNSCHNLSTGGVDNLPFSPGDDGTLGGRNSPTVFNAAFHAMQFWDGRAKDVEEQAGMPILNPVEMMIPNEAFLIDRLKGIDVYKSLFAAAYPGESQPISYTNLRKAIGAFERTLVTPSRFDDYLNGNSQALSIEEKEGMQAFMDAGCITCHSGAQLGGNMFQKFGVHADYWTATGSAKVDEGRAEVTKAEVDKYMFKVPSLRNVEKTWPYFHDGSVKELEKAVAIMAEINLNKKLSDQEVGSIVTFLKALNGELPAGVADEPAELKAQS
jgi:cytochrome c peroxidase